MVFHRDPDHLMVPVDESSSGLDAADALRELAGKRGFWIGLAAVIVVALLAAADVLRGAALVLVLFCGYFLPALIARRKPNASSVFVINLFLGWTVLGWVGALAMALSDPKPVVVVQQQAPRAQIGGRSCPYCAEDIKPAAIVCKHCGRDLPSA
jgi:hypothetical protein